MLRIIKRIHQLSFSALMDVYAQSNMEDGRKQYPNGSEAEQIQKAEEDFFLYLLGTFFRIPGAFCAVWEENGHYVSALRMEPYEDGWLLTGLETKPDKRKQGYAKRLLTETLVYLQRDTSVVVYSHVENDNIASRNIHHRCGFREILDYASYIDGTISRNAVTLKYDPIKHPD